MTGYSDRINHALAFAAKHHDRQVRKGTRLPYITHPANVAIILARYGRDDDTVVAGILHDTTGSYRLAFVAAIACSIVSAVTIWLSSPRKNRVVPGRMAKGT